MKYGRQMILTRSGDITTATESVYANFETVKQVTTYYESVRIAEDKDILAIFLKMLDDQKAGKIDQIGIQCLRNKETNTLRVEKTWTIPPYDLQ